MNHSLIKRLTVLVNDSVSYAYTEVPKYLHCSNRNREAAKGLKKKKKSFSSKLYENTFKTGDEMISKNK